MKTVADLQVEIRTLDTFVHLTSAFEAMASMQIARIKNQVLSSQTFFEELWNMYSSIRVDGVFAFGRRLQRTDLIQKELFILITAEGGFSGDIDEKLLKFVKESYDKEKNDIIVIGHHGAIQLTQSGIAFKRYFKLPGDKAVINVAPIIKEVQKYESTKVFYQTYVTLMNQDVKSISLLSVVEEKGKDIESQDHIISSETYLFEPSHYAVVDHLERSMLQIALTQVIYESKLAQYASRFRAMSAAHTESTDEYKKSTAQYNRAKRALKDKRLREVIIGLKASQGAKK